MTEVRRREPQIRSHSFKTAMNDLLSREIPALLFRAATKDKGENVIYTITGASGKLKLGLRRDIENWKILNSYPVRE